MKLSDRLHCAFDAFDQYNAKDPHTGNDGDKVFPKELLYSKRMTERLMQYEPMASEAVRLAARCQHIGRWELPREQFPMDRKGYLKWRSTLALHHAAIASKILKECSYDDREIEKVKFLLQKKELMQHHPETQLLEDVICLVFIEHYLEDFTRQHEEGKVVEILRKTIRKMSDRGVGEAKKIALPAHTAGLVRRALE